MSKILVKSAWGSDDPTKAAFAFLHSNALTEARHEVQIFLLGEAVSLMRDAVANSVVPVGWPPLAEILGKTISLHIPIHVCGVCVNARGVPESDLVGKNATIANPSVLVGLIEWADKLLSE
jgi:sulfur relay (sulfurtransferase) complex TusBCD TusD component (DsrE family)